MTHFDLLDIKYSQFQFSRKLWDKSYISEEIRKYFSKLIKPLATNTSLKEEVISEFESKISEQNDKNL